MKIQTFSIVVGGKKCNATCPYCVSKMTGQEDCTEEINFRNFHKACQFAKQSGVSTVLLTGKGEPTLYPALITIYLKILDSYDFPFIELQTNGIRLANITDKMYKDWYKLGLTTVSLSCVHWDNKKNREIFGKKYGGLNTYVRLLHENRFSVRVSCVMLRDYIKDVARVKEFANTCKRWNVEQFTIRHVSNDVKTIRPVSNGIKDELSTDYAEKYKIWNWIEDHKIDRLHRDEIDMFFRDNATLLLNLVHGAKVYDYEGQNISINNCLTHSPDPDNIRQLIFFPDGHLRFSWSYPGAILF